MKRNFIIRAVCIVLALLIVGSISFAALSANVFFAANTEEETVAASESDINSLKTDFEAAVGAQIDSAVSAAPTKNASGYVNASNVNLRKGAGTNYAVITCMKKNTKFTYVDGKLYNSVWYKIKLSSDSKTGYIHKDYAGLNSDSSSADLSSTVLESGYISGDYVNLRSGAGTNYSVITCMRKNTKFTFASSQLYNSRWYKIKLDSNSKIGYVAKEYVKITSQSTSQQSSSSSQKGYVNADYVNLRKGAGTNYAVVTCMRVNTKFTFISTSLTNKSWYNIKLDNGKTGYIYKEYASVDKSSGNASSGGGQSSSSSGIAISSSSETIYTGNKYALKYSSSGSVKWSSSNSSVATVDSNGVVTAKKSGSTTIKAASGSKSDSCKITVKSGSSVNISRTSITNMRRGKSVLLRSTTGGVKWKSSNPDVASVNNGIVDTKSNGCASIVAYTSSGAATCLISVIGRDNIRFTYATPNCASMNSTVTFKAITDTDRIAVRFVVSNGSTSYTVNATDKKKDGNTYIWSGSRKLSKSGKWTVKAYAKYKTSNEYLTTSGAGEGEVFVTSSSDYTTTVCSERRASEDIIKLIADYEGYLTSVTADSITSDPTLGYGKVVTTNEQFYNNITKTEAYAYLCQTVNKGGYTTRTNAFLLDNNIKFNQRQFDALVSFAYNVGASAIYNDSELQSVLLNSYASGSGKIAAGASGYVNASSVNLRSGPGTSYSVITNMSKNTKFTFVDGKLTNAKWYKIKLSNGKTGYIYSIYASSTSAQRDLKYTDTREYLDTFLQYHHASGKCYRGLLYRRVDEAEVFLYGDYKRDGQYNKKNIKYTCKVNSSFKIS